MSTNIYNATTDKLKDIGSGGGGGDPEALEAIENTITPSSTKEEEGAITATKPHSEGDYFNLGGVFVKALDDISVGDTLSEDVNYESTTVGDELSSMKSSFTAGCDEIVQAVTAKGSTPASNSPSDIASAIGNISTGGDPTHGAITLADFNNMTDAELLAFDSGDTSYGTPITIDNTASRVVTTGELSKSTFEFVHKHIYICTINRTDIEVPLWSSGTDAELVSALEKADTGEIDLSEYWHVGDERTVSLSAMNATGVGESHAAQDVVFVIMHVGLYKDANDKTVNFIVGLKDGLYNRGYMNSSNTNSGSWNSCARRTWCNNIFYNAIPSTLRPIFKQFKTVTAQTYNGSTNNTSLDYFALPAEKEVFGSTTYSNTIEANALTQFDYYKDATHRIKQSLGVDYYWWERSPRSSDTRYFCFVNSDGTAYNHLASSSRGLAPFGCI